jgi:hypothetical protein
LLCGEYNYHTFHAAVQEKFPDFHINKGYDWAEALCNGFPQIVPKIDTIDPIWRMTLT